MFKVEHSVVDQIPDDVFEVLNDVGCAQHLLGYDYLAYAINLVVEDKKISQRITKILYPSVAKAFDSTPSRVERAIRHSIEKCMSYIQEDQVQKYFGNSYDPSGSMSNSQFICTLANAVRKKLISKMG